MIGIRHDEKGVALLTVLLLVATVSVVAIGMTQAVTRATNRSFAAGLRDQAYWAIYGIEGAAIDYLRENAAQLGQPNTPLFQEPLILPSADGTATLRFSERSNCFNINNLVNKDADDERYVVDAGAADAFAILVRELGASQATGSILAMRIADFIDSNNQPEISSAEDFDYQRRKVPYRTAARFLASVSELRAVAGFSRDVYRGLLPYLCALPNDGPQKLNVNTLTPEDAPLLVAASLGTINRALAVRVIESRPVTGYKAVEDFQSMAQLSNIELPENFSDSLAVESGLIAMELILEGSVGRLRQESLIERGADVKVLERRFGERLP
ncbi:MAG: type II secretion system minor pseudopilin GspK [Pseudomonadota bacterium]